MPQTRKLAVPIGNSDSKRRNRSRLECPRRHLGMPKDSICGDRRAPMKTALLRLMQANSSRYRLWLENKRFADSIPPGALILDAGAGDAPYKSLVTHAVYESADFEKVDKAYAKSTYVC